MAQSRRSARYHKKDWEGLQKTMVGNENEVLCCFSGKWIDIDNAVSITLEFPDAKGESQILYSDKDILAKLIVPQIPLHPSLAN